MDNEIRRIRGGVACYRLPVITGCGPSQWTTPSSLRGTHYIRLQHIVSNCLVYCVETNFCHGLRLSLPPSETAGRADSPPLTLTRAPTYYYYYATTSHCSVHSQADRPWAAGWGRLTLRSLGHSLITRPCPQQSPIGTATLRWWLLIDPVGPLLCAESENGTQGIVKFLINILVKKYSVFIIRIEDCK